ncbi:MAG: 2-dehydropantoate 2-reductase [Nitrososphaerota archaeon]
MEILVVGAGALGLLISGLIAHNGGHVTLYSRRPEAIEHISKKGIRIITDNEEYVVRVKCIASIQKDNYYELAIVTVKSYDTETIAKLLAEKLNSQTFVLSLQNGLGNAEILASHLGKERVFPGITTQASTRLGINEVYHAFNGLTIIGEYDGPPTERVRRIADFLSNNGVTCIVSENIWREIWFKVMVNSVINPLTAIMKIKNEGLLKISSIELLIKDILSEIISVAKLYGYEFNLNECYEKIIKIIQDTRNNKSSMLQDIENKRRTEIDSLNGMITKLAEMHGLETPLNRALTIFVKGIEER